MTERKIQDYLHFYLGCKIRYAPLGGEYFDETMTGIDGWKVLTENEPDYACAAEECKLILRPLSDMAYEEFVEAGKIHISEGGTIAVTFDEVRSNTVLPMRPKTFAYLLSKGFDLFNLIPDGLAINKSTP